jgi:hypothetical protein
MALRTPSALLLNASTEVTETGVFLLRINEGRPARHSILSLPLRRPCVLASHGKSFAIVSESPFTRLKGRSFESPEIMPYCWPDRPPSFLHVPSPFCFLPSCARQARRLPC